MQFSACLDPQFVRNKYTHEYVQVPCGHCAACIVSRPRTKVQRLQKARELYYDSVFFTLTFSDTFVPRGDFAGTFVFHTVDLIKDGVNFADLRDFSDKLTFKYVTEYDKEYGFIPLLSKRIVREFISLLKERIQVPFDWFITGEYGPTTYRPHYHGLLFFNSRSDADVERVGVDDVSYIIRECWSTDILQRLFSFRVYDVKGPLGEVQIRYDLNSSAQYTAAYLNASTNLPRLLQVVFPPFSKYSRTLPDVDRLASSEIRELLFTANCYVHRTKNERGHILVNLDFPSIRVIRKYFPQFRGYLRLSDPCVVSLVLYVCSVSLEAFKEQVSMYYGCFGVFHTLYMIFGDNPTDQQLTSFYYLVRSARNIAKRFYVPLRHYFSMYTRVYSRLELVKLKHFYELQEQIADDPFLDIRYINGLYIVNKEEDKPFPGEDIRFSLLYDNPLFLKYQNQMTKILLDTSKTKKRNDYIPKVKL